MEFFSNDMTIGPDGYVAGNLNGVKLKSKKIVTLFRLFLGRAVIQGIAYIFRKIRHVMGDAGKVASVDR